MLEPVEEEWSLPLMGSLLCIDIVVVPLAPWYWCILYAASLLTIACVAEAMEGRGKT